MLYLQCYFFWLQRYPLLLLTVTNPKPKPLVYDRPTTYPLHKKMRKIHRKKNWKDNDNNNKNNIKKKAQQFQESEVCATLCIWWRWEGNKKMIILYEWMNLSRNVSYPHNTHFKREWNFLLVILFVGGKWKWT